MKFKNNGSPILKLRVLIQLFLDLKFNKLDVLLLVGAVYFLLSSATIKNELLAYARSAVQFDVGGTINQTPMHKLTDGVSTRILEQNDARVLEYLTNVHCYPLRISFGLPFLLYIVEDSRNPFS